MTSRSNGTSLSNGRTRPPGPARAADLLRVMGAKSLTSSYRRLLHGVYLRRDIQPTRHDWILAIQQARPNAVVTGWEAAGLYGHEFVPGDACIEVLLPRTGMAPRMPADAPPCRFLRRTIGAAGTAGTVHRRGLLATSPALTAFSLAQLRNDPGVPVIADPLETAVAAVDGLCRALPGLHRRLLHWSPPPLTGVERFRDVLRLVDPRAESPMETATRLRVLRRHGISGFHCQFWVQLGDPVLEDPVLGDLALEDLDGRAVGAAGPRHRRFRLDFADPVARIGVEYDGAHHRDPGQLRADADRDRLLARSDWVVEHLVKEDLGSASAVAAVADRILWLQARRGRGGAG